MSSREEIDFVVGAEKKLTDVLGESEALPLLRCAVQAGVGGAALCDEAGIALWSQGTMEADDHGAWLHLEGEPVGQVRLSAAGAPAEVVSAVGAVVTGALQSVLNSNLKRMLTTEIHTRVVNASYEELVETNRRLSHSEARYRELAESLEAQVARRTDELKRAYAHLLQQEKMASIGQLAAGMAHEINNPLGFILSNLRSFGKYVGRFDEMLRYYREAPLEAGIAEDARLRWAELKLDFIRDDLDDLLQQSISGAERVKKIVADLKGFSHIDDAEKVDVDVHAEIERTLSVLAREIPEGTEIVKDFGQIPPLSADPGLLCQSLFNIVRNALQSRREGLHLTIATTAAQGRLRIRVSDNGPGIPEPIRERIFEPFFTTRTVGEGTGMGLTVAFNNVTALGGAIVVESPPQGGSTFVIELPSEDHHGTLR